MFNYKFIFKILNLIKFEKLELIHHFWSMMPHQIGIISLFGLSMVSLSISMFYFRGVFPICWKFLDNICNYFPYLCLHKSISKKNVLLLIKKNSIHDYNLKITNNNNNNNIKYLNTFLLMIDKMCYFLVILSAFN